jgi:regulator of protease activity HflC (stomatin/prohibitin superfamily)
MILEKPRSFPAGIPHVVLAILSLVASVVLLIVSARAASDGYPAGPFGVVGGLVAILASILWLSGLFVVNPNEAKVIQLFGSYVATAREPGLRWGNPFYSKQKVSTRIRNFETDRLKVNDQTGNPVDIATVVVWRVVDTAEAVFNVDDFQDFVEVQSEAALRNLATQYPYDDHGGEGWSLASNTNEISDKLKEEIQDRLEKAGIEVMEARISHLAYASEIAAAMLQRQQASAVVAARAQIVEGAVGMVEHALDRLSERQVIELDEDKKAAMVSNLLVVLCSDRHTQPVVNTGTLHH